MSTNIVKLNIGGTVFQTRNSTLTKFDGFFKTLLETAISVEKDEAGCIFVDRSPKHFDLILNFMRDGKVVLPNSEQDVQEILNEAEYYLLQGLIEICGGELPPKAEVWKGVRIVRSKEEMKQLRDKTKPLLHICYGKAFADSFLQPSDNVLSFVQKHESRFDIFFEPHDEYKYSILINPLKIRVNYEWRTVKTVEELLVLAEKYINYLSTL